MTRLMRGLSLLVALSLLGVTLISGCAVKREIIIDQSGRGTYTSIRNGLNDWEPGQTITIREGVYDEQVILQTFMQIVGEGRVVIEYSGDGPAMHGRDVSSVVVNNLTLRLNSQTKNPTVRLRGSDVAFDRCAIEGGSVAGIEALHFGMLTLTNSLVSGNGWAGVYLHDQARAVIEDSTIENNERGVAVVAFPEGVPNVQQSYREDELLPVVMRKAELLNNSLLGVMLAAGAEAKIEECTISGNGAPMEDLGEMDPDEAQSQDEGDQPSDSGEAEEAKPFSLDMAGVLVKERSTLWLAKSVVSRNLLGVVFQMYAGGSVVGSTIERNIHYGVACVGSGKPEIIGNSIKQNGSGAIIRDGSQSVFNENQIVGNTYQGIEIGDSGLPMIEKNVIAQNGQSGLFVFDNGKPTVRYNVLAYNGWYGVLAARQGRPVVLNNTLVGNKKKAVWFTQKAEGVFANNVITDSPVGISVKGNGLIAPRLLGNLLWGCKASFEGFTENPPSFIEDPQFADAPAGDYRPLPGSPILTRGEGKTFLGAYGEAAKNP
jgi:parallel beta-helix repeat protein